MACSLQEEGFSMKFSRYLALCILAGTLLLFTSCSSQNPVVNPSPGTWRIVHSENPGTATNNLYAVAATSVSDAWAVGNYSNNHLITQGGKTLIEHWNGTTWSTVQSQNPGKQSNNLSAIVARSPHDIWAVGAFNSVFSDQQAQLLIEHWNGTVWSTVPSPNIGTNNTSLGGVTVVPHSSRLWAVGSGAIFGTVSVPSPNATQPTSVMSVTAETLIETCCS